MATVYIIYSEKLDCYYTGSCKDFDARLKEHLNKTFKGSFTSQTDDWQVYLTINNLNYNQARKIELHIPNIGIDSKK
ncbi:MAG: hypothetical protein Kow0068_13830 [Marinilabiliales bacterium]